MKKVITSGPPDMSACLKTYFLITHALAESKFLKEM